MKLITRITLGALIAALSLPAASFAAKAEKKTGDAQEQRFAKMDTDSDGSISEAEFIAAQGKSGKEANAKTRFARLDKNGDAKVSKEEFAAGAGKKGEGKKKKEQP
jgi:Ca2+-binding EF-hand superfamily protein